MDQKKSVLLLKVLLWLGASAPGAWLIAGVFQEWLGANPIEKLTHVTGMTALILLLLTLSITPLRRMTGWNQAPATHGAVRVLLRVLPFRDLGRA